MCSVSLCEVAPCLKCFIYEMTHYVKCHFIYSHTCVKGHAEEGLFKQEPLQYLTGDDCLCYPAKETAAQTSQKLAINGNQRALAASVTLVSHTGDLLSLPGGHSNGINGRATRLWLRFKSA